MHLGCVLIIAGSMRASEAGHKLQKWLLGIDKIPTGQMRIFEGHSDNRVMLDHALLFSIELEFQSDLDNGTISEELRQEFEENEVPLSEHVTISVEEPGSTWWLIDELKEYLVRKEELRLNICDPIKELPFHIRLKDFRMEYYEPEYLHIGTREGQSWKIPVEVGSEFSLGPDFGTVTIVRAFENFKISFDGDKKIVIDDPEPGYNPALEVQIEHPEGSMSTQYAFERFPGHAHRGDRFILSYRRVIREYVSELEVIRDDKVVAEKDIEVNHPLGFGGYHFYQDSYDSEAGQYTILRVVSDSGLNFVYAGYVMLGIGVFWHLWLRESVRSRTRPRSK
jgi:hypothetical protein